MTSRQRLLPTFLLSAKAVILTKIDFDRHRCVRQLSGRMPMYHRDDAMARVPRSVPFGGLRLVLLSAGRQDTAIPVPLGSAGWFSDDGAVSGVQE
ncbi:hypothetical protein GCM10009827_101510 [Dactylosporangium maewongense]|uniref:Uncharacterized protein n=1 Tax=Dactylosporangium maewongense TaxID=634393 RepID=A0ABN2CUQ5_9ACTN